MIHRRETWVQRYAYIISFPEMYANTIEYNILHTLALSLFLSLCLLQQHRIQPPIAIIFHFRSPWISAELPSHKIQGSQKTTINACWFFDTEDSHICNCWCYRCCRCHLNFRWNKFHLMRSPFLNNINVCSTWSCYVADFHLLFIEQHGTIFLPTTNFPFFLSFKSLWLPSLAVAKSSTEEKRGRKSQQNKRNWFDQNHVIKKFNFFDFFFWIVLSCSCIRGAFLQSIMSLDVRLRKNQCSINVIIVAFHYCQIIIFILKLLHDRRERESILCHCHCHFHTIQDVIYFPSIECSSFAARFCSNRLFSEIVFCLLVGRLIGRAVESKEGTKVYFKYIITIFRYRQLCEHRTLNSHQAEIEKLFSMLLFPRRRRRRTRMRGKK